MVFDCGSTNIRVAAVDESGEILAQASAPNGPIPQPGSEGWLVWDVDGIWLTLCRLSREVLKQVGSENVAAVSVTTWGADGALIKRDGSLAYPAISWQCQRTREVVHEVLELIDPRKIFRITGYQVIHFNTLFKWFWIKRNVPEAFKQAYTWLMMPGVVAVRLCGVHHVDPTSASTTMAMNMGKRDWSEEMLALAGLDPGFFPEWIEPGEVVGYVSEKASRETGINAGTPVVSAGHDTQFAILAAHAQEGEAVLSSGTWEILALRLNRFDPNDDALELGVLIEADVEKGKWNPQLLMIASAVLEWLKRLVYPELTPGDYGKMVEEAESIEPGSGGLLFVPSFVPDSGPLAKYGVKGVIEGLQLGTSRGHLYRSALEGLSMQLRLALESLERAYKFKARGVRVVGGGSRNDLWNRIRAGVLGLSVSAPRWSEATVIGAAIAAFKGAGVYRSFEEGLRNVSYDLRIFEPKFTNRYDVMYRYFIATVESLSQAMRRV